MYIAIYQSTAPALIPESMWLVEGNGSVLNGSLNGAFRLFFLNSFALIHFIAQHVCNCTVSGQVTTGWWTGPLTTAGHRHRLVSGTIVAGF